MKSIILILFSLILVAHSDGPCDKKNILKYCLKHHASIFKHCTEEKTKICTAYVSSRKQEFPTPTALIPTTTEMLQTQQVSTTQATTTLPSPTERNTEETTIIEHVENIHQELTTSAPLEIYMDQDFTTFGSLDDSPLETTTFAPLQESSPMDQGLTTSDRMEQMEGFPIMDGFVPTDSGCKKIDIDYTRISKVCVQRRANKFCLKSFPTEYQHCLKSVEIGLCYKTCFVNITPCIYQVPINLPSSPEPNQMMATPTPNYSKSPNKLICQPATLFSIIIAHIFAF